MCLIYIYPESQQALVIGVAMSGFGLGGGFCSMVNLIINPGNIKANINFLGDGDYIYPLYITSHILLFQLIYLGVVIVLGAISIIWTCDYSKIRPSVLIDQPIDVSNDISGIKGLEDPIRRNDVDSDDSFYAETICHKFFSFRSYSYLIIIILTSITPFVSLFTFDEFARHNYPNSAILLWSVLGFVVMCGISRICWGALFNAFNKQYKLFIYIVLSLQLLFGSAFYYSVQWSWGYFVNIMLIGFTYGGLTILFPLKLFKFYNEYYFLRMYSLLSIGQAFIAIMVVPFMNILSRALPDYKNLHLAMYMIGAGSNLIAGIFVFCTKDELSYKYRK